MRATRALLCVPLQLNSSVRPQQLSMKTRLMLAKKALVVGLLATLACGRDRVDLTRFREPDRAAVRAVLDSFADLSKEPTAVEDVSSQGDTVLVTLIAGRGAAHPGSWDGPRTYVWVLRPARIVRSKVVMVD